MKAAALAIAFLALLVDRATAGGEVIDVTPANISVQRPHMTVETSHDGGTVHFHIAIFPTSAVSPKHCGTFELIESPQPWWSRLFGRDAPGHAAISCPVAEEARGDTLVYALQVHKNLLERARFTFGESEPTGMPSFTVFRLALLAFDEAGQVSPNSALHAPGAGVGRR